MCFDCNTVLPYIFAVMAAKKADEPKQVFTYRARPSIVKKAKQKCKKIKTSISEIVEGLLIDFNQQ